MTLPFLILAVITIASGVAAMTLRNLVHCALALAVCFAGLAAFYLQLGAQFAGFAQLLVYVGAVAILIVFAILLTRGGEAPQQSVFSSGWLSGTVIAVAVFGILAVAIRSSKFLSRDNIPVPEVTIRDLGNRLMTKFVLPLEVMGLLLTAALIGAVIIAMREEKKQ